MTKEIQYVDQSGNPINFIPREGDSLDVGFGGSLDRLMEKLSFSKKIMDVAEEKYPYELTGTKTKGKITKTIGNENREFSSKMIDDLEYDEPIVEVTKPSSIKELKQQQRPPVKKQQREDDEYMYYNTGYVDDELDFTEKNTPSLTSELLNYSKNNRAGDSLDVSGPVTTEAFKRSKMPDFIKESLMKNPIKPPSMSVALGGGQLDALTEKMTEKMRKMGYMKEQQEQPKPKQQQQRKQTLVENQQQLTKREKIKEQLRPIVEELITEILAQKLLR